MKRKTTLGALLSIVILLAACTPGPQPRASLRATHRQPLSATQIQVHQ